MGPLVPEIISPDMSLIIALGIGFFFGFSLEQAGFSTTHKLVGLFYGYDFTVLRVFFTAGITGMIGVLLLSHLGLLDLSLIYVNPIFLRSAIVGGLVMGAGFIVGGFCPGTSVCAAATGKLDAMVFILGSFVGIAAFGEGFPFLEEFYAADNWGPMRIDTSLNLSPTLFALLIVVVAVGIFTVVRFIENKVTRTVPKVTRRERFKTAALTALPLAVLALTAVTPSRKEAIAHKTTEAVRRHRWPAVTLSSDKLADELSKNAFEINLIDVRSKEEFQKGHLPLAVNIPLGSIEDRAWERVFRQHYKSNIFYAENVNDAGRAAAYAAFTGDAVNYVLGEPMSMFQQKILKASKPGPQASKHALDVYLFRSRAAAAIDALDRALSRFSAPVNKTLLKTKGGCS